MANGLLIGTGVGAAVGLAVVTYWWIADPNECSGGPCMQDMLVPTIMGSLAGFGVDAAIRSNVTLYEVSTSKPSTRSYVLQVVKARKGVALRIRF